MTLEIVLFYLAFIVYVAGWALLIPFSRRTWANFWWAGVIAPLVLSLLSLFLLVAYWRGEPHVTLFDFFSLEGFGRMFRNPGLLLAAFVEILATALVSGAWMARKGEQVRIPPPYVTASLIATAVNVPAGFILFAIVAAAGGRWQHIAECEEPPQTDSDPVAAEIPARTIAPVKH